MHAVPSIIGGIVKHEPVGQVLKEAGGAALGGVLPGAGALLASKAPAAAQAISTVAKVGSALAPALPASVAKVANTAEEFAQAALPDKIKERNDKIEAYVKADAPNRYDLYDSSGMKITSVDNNTDTSDHALIKSATGTFMLKDFTPDQLMKLKVGEEDRDLSKPTFKQTPFGPVLEEPHAPNFKEVLGSVAHDVANAVSNTKTIAGVADSSKPMGVTEVEKDAKDDVKRVKDENYVPPRPRETMQSSQTAAKTAGMAGQSNMKSTSSSLPQLKINLNK